MPAGRDCLLWPSGCSACCGARSSPPLPVTAAIPPISGWCWAFPTGFSGASSCPGSFAWSSQSGFASGTWRTMTWGRIPRRAQAMPDVAVLGHLPLAVAEKLPTSGSPYILVAFGAYMVGVFLLGALAHHLLDRGSFLKE